MRYLWSCIIPLHAPVARSLGHFLLTGCTSMSSFRLLGPVLAHLRAMALENQIWASQFSPALVDAAAMTYFGCLRSTGRHPSSKIDQQRVRGLRGGLDWLSTQYLIPVRISVDIANKER